MNDKQQLAAIDEHMAEHVAQAQPLCMAKRIEELDGQVRVMADLLREARSHVVRAFDADIEFWADNPLLLNIDAALAGKLTDPAVTVTETIRTAPARIWLQVGDQTHYHSEPFPSDTGDVTWCADSVVGCEVPYVRVDLATIVPEGWQLVPVTPTGEMLRAYAPEGCAILAMPGYRAMLAAAPKPEAK